MAVTDIPVVSGVQRHAGFLRALDIVSLVLLGAGIAWFAAHNLGNHYLWTDEATTFWTALGSPPAGQELGSLATAWQGTMAGFLDPGLYHVLVRIWAVAFGTDIVTLRLLPFIFFLVYVGAILGVTRLLGAPWFMGAGVAGLMMLENITPYYAVELRPYSAGLAASVALPLLALWLIKSPGVLRLIVLLAGVALLGSMQYNTMPIEWAVALILVVAWLGNPDRRNRAALAVAAIFTVFWLPIFYLVSRGNPLRSSGGNSLGYISELVLTSMPHDRLLHVILTNFFSPTGLPRTIFLLAVPLLWWRRLLPFPRSSTDWPERSLNLLWIFVLAATAATIALAVMGFIPWILGTRWSISEVGLIALSLAGLAGLLVRSSLWRRPVVLWLSAVACVLLAGLGAVRLWAYERPNDVDVMAALAPVILSGQPGATVIDGWTYPEARYWMEFSGQHDALRQEWIDHGVRATPGFDRAQPADVLAFLSSSDDRMVLRSSKVLTDGGITLPPNVEVVSVPRELRQGPLTVDLPVVLVKRS